MQISNKRKIIFVTGTRADYGKMKPLMQALEKSDVFETHIFVCGMHLSRKFGNTYREVIKDGYANTHIAYGLTQSADASINLGNTISYFSGYVENVDPDMIIVHGDRVDALAGATVGALRNVLVGHIEGGELSGTVDESIRHAISKFAHIHFVCTPDAAERLVQLGEQRDRIYIIGSPDIDIMMSSDLPELAEAKGRYGIDFDEYAILMYHPVTTEYKEMGAKARAVVDAVIESGCNYIVIYPNNDLGSETILHEYERLETNPHFKLFPSLRFEHFLTLLKHAEFLIGNSSAGIRESGVYGIPSIDIGTRQNGRYNPSKSLNISHVTESKTDILNAIGKRAPKVAVTKDFGSGDSTAKFCDAITREQLWKTSLQKHFADFK